MTEKSDQEQFLVGKMVERVGVLLKENAVFVKKLEDPNLSDKDYDLYQGLVDKNIGEQQAYRRMEDNLREWRELERTKEPEPPQLCGKDGCGKTFEHMGVCLP